MLRLALLAGLAGATTLEDTGDTGYTSSTLSDTGFATTDTDVPAPVVFSEGEGAAEISGEAGGQSWKGCGHAPSAAWLSPLAIALMRRSRR